MNIIQVLAYVIGGGIALAPVIGLIISTKLFLLSGCKKADIRFPDAAVRNFFGEYVCPM